jgi:multiple antibiotic resistance protein
MADTLTTVLRVAMLAVAALVPLINPAGTAPIFLSLTSGASDHVRSIAAARVARNTFVLLAGAMLGGSSILLFFGLSLAEIRIAGGFLVIATAWHLIRTDQQPDAALVVLSQGEPHDPLAHAVFYPLTFPVTIGPGSLSIAVALGADARGAPAAASLAGGVVGTAVVASVVYLCYRFAARVARVLGPAGTLVLLRISAFILLSVGVKIFCDGLIQRFMAGST